MKESQLTRKLAEQMKDYDLMKEEIKQKDELLFDFQTRLEEYE